MNYRVPFVVTPEGRLISPASCWVVWLTDGEVNNWRSAVKGSHRYLGETVALFGGQSLKIANFTLGPRPIAERFRDESATERRPEGSVVNWPRYDLFLKGVSELELHILQHTLEDRYAAGNFDGGRESEAARACASLMNKITQWVKDVAADEAIGEEND